MEYPEKALAVREFLREAYPGDKVEDRYDVHRKACIFQIRGKGPAHTVIVEDGFLAAIGEGEISAKLTEFTLLEHIRELGATPLRVTREGLKLEFE